MSEKTVQWLTVLIFFFCFFAYTLAESAWLQKKGGSPLGKAFAFSFATNIFTLTVGFALSFVLFALLATYTIGSGLEPAAGGDPRVWGAGAASLVLPIAVSVAAKRLLLRVFKIDAGVGPWTFAVVASVLFVVVAAAVPVIISSLA